MVKQDQRVLESMEIAMLLITQQSCCILLGIQTRTQLLVPLQIACTCTMLNSILSKNGAFPCSRLLFFLVPYGDWWGLLYTYTYIISMTWSYDHMDLWENGMEKESSEKPIILSLFFFFLSVEFFTLWTWKLLYRPRKKQENPIGRNRDFSKLISYDFWMDID